MMSDDWINIVDRGKTKYNRLRHLIVSRNNVVLLSIDNDIKIYDEALSVFIERFLDSSSSVGWGKIGVGNRGFIPNIIRIDKFLSHCLIRPVLWKCGVGVSIPGQCFILRTADYCRFLPEQDTFLDDLQIGLITCCRGYDILASHLVLGDEKVQDTFPKLFRQRKRWAAGFASTLKTARTLSIKHLILVLLHGAAYHLFFPALLILLLCLCKISTVTASVIAIGGILWLCHAEPKLLFSALSYCMIFPFVHLFWLFAVIVFFLRPKHDYRES